MTLNTAAPPARRAEDYSARQRRYPHHIGGLRRRRVVISPAKAVDQAASHQSSVIRSLLLNWTILTTSGAPLSPAIVVGSTLPRSEMKAVGFFSACSWRYFWRRVHRAPRIISRTLPLILLGMPGLRPAPGR